MIPGQAPILFLFEWLGIKARSYEGLENITYKSIVPIPYVVEDAVSSTAVGRAALVLQWYCYVR